MGNLAWGRTRQQLRTRTTGERDVVDRAVTHMDVLLSELLVQALAERSERELARGERARDHVPAQAARRAREDERAALAARIERVLAEGQDRPARERERPVDVGVHDARDVALIEREERLPDGGRRVVNRNAELARSARGPRVRGDRGEDICERLVAVRVDRERGDFELARRQGRGERGDIGQLRMSLCACASYAWTDPMAAAGDIDRRTHLSAGGDYIVRDFLELVGAAGNECNSVTFLRKGTPIGRGGILAHSCLSPLNVHLLNVDRGTRTPSLLPYLNGYISVPAMTSALLTNLNRYLFQR